MASTSIPQYHKFTDPVRGVGVLVLLCLTRDVSVQPVHPLRPVQAVPKRFVSRSVSTKRPHPPSQPYSGRRVVGPSEPVTNAGYDLCS